MYARPVPHISPFRLAALAFLLFSLVLPSFGQSAYQGVYTFASG